MIEPRGQSFRRFKRAPATSALALTADILLQRTNCSGGPITSLCTAKDSSHIRRRMTGRSQTWHLKYDIFILLRPRGRSGSAMKDVISSEEYERQLVRNFFNGIPGFFVEVGANHPVVGSQSWHLEQCGWRGILVEPQPELAERLQELRHAKVFAAACSSPKNAGQLMPFFVAGTLSALDRDTMSPGSHPERVIQVPVRTLDDILAEGGAPQPLDFLSIDVEGHEIQVLRGFNFARWRPRLILLEDHVGNLSKHWFVKSCGYRLVRRTGYNGWYVPANSPVHFGWKDRWQVLRKYYLALPFRILRNFSRRLRQPIKDRMRARRDVFKQA